jgi:flagellar basal-body rod modification protein FlgD
MAIASIGTTPVNTATPTNASLGQSDFLKILMTQLQFQDPMKPMDNQAFLAQMAQFTTLEMTQQQNDKTETLLTLQAATQAIGLIGKQVEVTTSNGQQIGSVTAISFQSDGTPQLSVMTSGGAALTNISLSQIALVRGQGVQS